MKFGEARANRPTVRWAMRHPDKLGAGARRRRKLPPKARMEAVMAEYKRGTLRSGSGEHVTKRSQAVAIGMSESGKSRGKRGR